MPLLCSFCLSHNTPLGLPTSDTSRTFVTNFFLSSLVVYLCYCVVKLVMICNIFKRDVLVLVTDYDIFCDSYLLNLQILFVSNLPTAFTQLANTRQTQGAMSA